MSNVPFGLDLAFAIVTVLAVLYFVHAVKGPWELVAVIAAWGMIIGGLAGAGFYLHTQGLPPRFAMVPAMPMLGIVILFTTNAGSRTLDRADPGKLTLFHVVRVAVELVLYGLFLHGAVPGLMTFAGRNLDILSGLSAPLIYWAGYRRKLLPPWALIAWNIVCLGLLANIVVNAVLSAPFDFQVQAFDQPNVAVLCFPYIWLPGILVPLVACAHLICLRTLMRGRKA